MPSVSFSELNSRKVEVRLSINDLMQRFRGTGCYESDVKLGNVLRIDVEDDAGGFSLILQEGESKCVINPAHEPGVDYHVQL